MHEPTDLIESGDLWKLVDELTNPTRQRIVRDDGTVEHAHVPSLWDQLGEAVGVGSEGHSKSKPGSRPPLSIGAASLRTSIVADLINWAPLFAIKLDFLGGTLGHDGRIDFPVVVRRLTSIVIGDANGQQLQWWHNTLGSWVTRIRATIGAEQHPARRMRSIGCPHCGARFVLVDDDEGQRVRQPPLLLTYDEAGQPKTATCGACGAEYLGLDGLVQLAEAQNSLPDDPATAVENTIALCARTSLRARGCPIAKLDN